MTLTGSLNIWLIIANQRQVAEHFPGVQLSAIKKAYYSVLKGLCDTFTQEEVVDDDDVAANG